MVKDSKAAQPKKEKKHSNKTHHKRRNPELVKSINRSGRHVRASQTFRFWKLGAAGKKVAPKQQEQKPPASEPRWYAADDVNTPIPSRKNRHKPTRLRPSITPGTVLIVLSGRFRGKRVVFLKQLPSGMLLITGPYKINGVPLRRINQVYVIATSTKVDVSKVDVSSISDAWFAKVGESKKKKKDDKEFFQDNAQKKGEISQVRKDTQKVVDGVLLPVVNKVPNLAAYLNAKFSLTNGQRPHLMVF